jgi:hypothetical protein
MHPPPVRRLPRAYKLGITAAIILSFASLGVSGAMMFAALTGQGRLADFLHAHAKPPISAPMLVDIRDKQALTVSILQKAGDPLPSETKGGLNFTIIPRLPEPATASQPQETAAIPEPEVDVEPTSAAVPEGVPILLVKGANGQGSKITSFKPIVMQGDAEECVSIGNALAVSAQLPADALDVLVANSQITIAKLCAANGAIVFTCRNNQIAISPRKPRPDDACVRS